MHSGGCAPTDTVLRAMTHPRWHGFMRTTAAKDPHSERMLRRLGAQAATTARCLMSDGTEPLPPLQTVTNPSRSRIAYMEWLFEQFRGYMTFALADCNTGEGAVRKYRGVPPYKETQNYVKRVARICKLASAARAAYRLVVLSDIKQNSPSCKVDLQA